ncbi:ImmA/IrrE family metallo-endopeptidase [Legionella bononiensis]|uniref:ImmA/IrrE family metallo-endopeptidase n=1 Tax=Legionella bononiensis TaxID=2793102 RepID=A0ABS1WEJ3_9GAMM|nr:ImmA/IrrE family metallo-endopeptidase [Legionella bononiensis]MBL7479314.1 ImmA/IrrE family metallo-endopeptidase [Legionella bononiensis]MBL7479366.1 ImmA/IrrE family metallo-endopeptidase [Legionella bononiensis]MBL7527782.1 ImmA/IrrE family metallo-endopeptidase [Legionella bononiensis]MBL7563537.1 ImmA/IrrE family metallo-endopeptidase [Legionella bononiensis]
MAHLYFFEKTQSSLSNFNSKLQTAINLIRQNNSLVALKVMEVIDSDQVSIRSFFDLSKDHWRRMKHDMKKEDNIILPNTYPPSEQAVKMIESELNGIIYEDRYIYISRKRTPEQMASTLVHEICHFLNSGLMDQERLSLNSNLVSHNEEVRSFAAEKMFERNGHCLRRSDIKELHEMVTDLYPEFNDTGDDEPELGYIFASYDSPIN